RKFIDLRHGRSSLRCRGWDGERPLIRISFPHLGGDTSIRRETRGKARCSRPLAFSGIGDSPRQRKTGERRRGGGSDPRAPVRGTTVFETAPFDRSGTSPHGRYQRVTVSSLRTQVDFGPKLTLSSFCPE